MSNSAEGHYPAHKVCWNVQPGLGSALCYRRESVFTGVRGGGGVGGGGGGQ